MIDRIKADAQALAAAEAGEWEACATRLNTIATSIRKPESQARKTWVGLQDLYGFDQAKALKRKLLSAIALATSANDIDSVAELTLIDQSLQTGYDFGNPKSQEQIDKLGNSGLLSSNEVLSLKAIGVVKPIVTAAEVEAEWAESLLADALSEVKRKASAAVAQATLAYDADGATAQAITDAGTAGWGS